jgi:argininosuccinate synthase
VTQVTNGRVVLGYAGTPADAASLRQLVGLGEMVVTVTVDVGQTAGVDHVRDQALALGAARAHVLDLREEFARDVVIPALRSGALDTIAGRVGASPFVQRKLSEVARIEHSTRVEGSDAFDAPLEHHGARSLVERPVIDPSDAPDAAAHVDLQIEGGVPVAINGVPLSVAELLESVALIAGQHGVGRLPHLEAPAIAVVHAAYRALDGGDGVVRFRLHKGELSVLPVHDSNPQLVNNA